MTTIVEGSKLCTVIVTVDAAEDDIPVLQSHASDGLTWFAEYEGFVSGALHRSTDGRRLIQYLQWETEQHHLDCINDSRWDDDPSTRRFMDLIESGQAKIDVRKFDVIASTNKPSDNTKPA
jgi:hypothetical protein